MDFFVRLLSYFNMAGAIQAVIQGLFLHILTSSDGAGWKQSCLGPGGALLGIAYRRDTFAAVGANRTILQSDPVLPRLQW